MKVVSLTAAVLAASASGVSATLAGLNTTGYVNDMFDQSMSFLDTIYDPTAGYLWYFYYPLAPGKHETRSTVWYAAGLLRRNQGSDVEDADKILTSVIGDQQKNVSDQWYGDYTKYPEEPTVGTDWYPENVSSNSFTSITDPHVTNCSLPRSTTHGILTGAASSAPLSS